jgi:hypothetical protein
MASLREAARYVLDDARDGCCWIAIWKTGRSWHTETFYDADYDEGSTFLNRPSSWKITAEDASRLKEIMAEDSAARFVHGYYSNLGSIEDMTLDSLTDGLRFQYEFGGNIDGILDVAEIA